MRSRRWPALLVPLFFGAECRCNCIPNFAVDPGSDTVSSIWVVGETSGTERMGLGMTLLSFNDPCKHQEMDGDGKLEKLAQ